MAASTTISTIVYETRVDTSGLSSGLKDTEKMAAASGTSAGTKMGASLGEGLNKASQASLGLVKKGLIAGAVAISAVVATHIDSAIKRVDTMNNFPKVLANIGVSTKESTAVIEDLSNKLKGLPTSLDSAAASVQRFTMTTGDVRKAEGWFLALNNAILAGGAPMEIQTTALEQFTQMLAVGTPDMMAWRSVIQAMPAQMQQLATSMGYVSGEAGGDLYKAFQDGTVSADELMNKMMELDTVGGEGFASFAEQAKSATGGVGTAINNFDNAVNRAIANVIKTIGEENINNMIKEIGDAFESAGKTIGEVIGFIADNKEVFTALAIGIGVVVAALTALAIVQAMVNVVMLASPITWIIIGVMLLVAAIVLLIMNFESIAEVVGSVLNSIGEFFVNIWGSIVGFFSGIFSEVLNFLQSVWSSIVEVFSPVADFFAGVFKVIWDIISGFFIFAVAIWAIVAEFFYNTLIKPILEYFLACWNTISGVLITIGSWIYNNVIQPIADFFVGLWNGIVDGARTFIESVRNFILPIVSWIHNSVIKPISSFFSGLWDGIVGMARGFAETVRNIFNTIVGFIKAPINGIIGGINTVIRGINSVKVPDWVPGLGGMSANIPTIPHLAAGGIVESTVGGQIILAGEAGQDEWVVPENKMASLIEQLNGGGGDTYNVNMSGIVAASEADKRKLAMDFVEQIELVKRSRMGATA